jgi:hypothetical protein
MHWAVAITTAPRPTSYLESTLRSLANAGWDAATISAEPGARLPMGFDPKRVAINPHCLGPHQNFRAALARLVNRDAGADAYAVFQDDIEVTSGLRRLLEAGGLWPSPRVGVVSLYTAAPNHSRRIGWHKCERLPQKAFGALAYVFPPSSALAFLSAPARPTWAQTDYWVGHWCEHAQLEYWMHSPSFVRHLGEASSIDGRRITQHRQCREFVPAVSGSTDHLSA